MLRKKEIFTTKYASFYQNKKPHKRIQGYNKRQLCSPGAGYRLLKLKHQKTFNILLLSDLYHVVYLRVQRICC